MKGVSQDKKDFPEDAEPGSQSNLRSLCCPACGMTLNYVPPPTTMPQSETTTQPTSEVIAPRRDSAVNSEGITGSKSS